jgi:hypothetical protein
MSTANKNSKFVYTTTHCVMRYELPRLTMFFETAVLLSNARFFLIRDDEAISSKYVMVSSVT